MGKKLLAASIFLLLLVVLYLQAAQLFRGTESFSRENVAVFLREPKNSIDVVLIGGSNAYSHWDPMQAWREYGIASFNYGSPGMPAAAHPAVIGEICKRQTPTLIVIEVRKYLSRFGEGDNTFNGNAKSVFDSMPYGWNRARCIHYFTKLFQLRGSDELANQIDLINFHTNVAALGEEYRWRLQYDFANRSKPVMYKGCNNYFNAHTFFEPPDSGVFTDDMAVLIPELEQTFCDMLDVAAAYHVNLLLIVNPIGDLTEQDEAEINALREIAAAYGYPLLDGNRYVDEIGVDYRTDFRNNAHVNILGLAKNTAFLANYMKRNYTLPDRRGDEAYASWDRLYEEYAAMYAERTEKEKALIDEHEQTAAKGQNMVAIADPVEWISLSNDPGLAVFVLVDAPCETALTDEAAACLKWYGMDKEALRAGNYSAVYWSGKQLGASSGGRVAGKISAGTDISYAVRAGEEKQLQINGTDYYDAGECIHLLLYDTNRLRTVDDVLLHIDEAGGLTMEHQKLREA